jgi:glycosyltransferase involved in cell wall biosynthesis
MTEVTPTVSVVVLTRNVEHLLKQCLESIAKTNPLETIIVDGMSTDRTIKIANEMGAIVVSDEGKGFSYARQLGLETAKGSHVFYVGADNLLEPDTINQLMEELQRREYAGIQPQVQVMLDEDSTYWDKCWNDYLEVTHSPGKKKVIGTPTLFDRELVLKIGYDSAISATDDTDVCQRLGDIGHSVGVGEAITYEHQRLTYRDFYRRWRWYGVGDARFIFKYRRRPRIALRHFLHPARTYMLGLAFGSILRGKPSVMPFYVMCGLFRYLGLSLETSRAVLRRRSDNKGFSSSN